MIFQNFGFNRLKVKGAAAPAAAVFPDQSIRTWTSTETAQWLSAASSVFAVGNGVTYSAPASISTSLGSNIFGGKLARNGKIYMAGDGGTTIYVWNTNTSTMTNITSPYGLVNYTGYYNDYSKCVYFVANGYIVVVDTLTDTIAASIANPVTGNYGSIYGSGYDGRYIYGNGWFSSNTWFKVDTLNNTATSLSPVTSQGDTLTGMMAANGKLYMGSGGGSGGGLHVWNANTDTNEFVSALGNTSDIYRTVCTHYDGYAYTFPAYGASNIWQITPSTNGGTSVLGSVTDIRAQASVMGADGLIYVFGNPTFGTNNAYTYNPIGNSVSYFTAPQQNLQWCVMDVNGHIYFGQGTNLYKMTASNVPAATATALAEYNGIIARMR